MFKQLRSRAVYALALTTLLAGCAQVAPSAATDATAIALPDQGAPRPTGGTREGNQIKALAKVQPLAAINLGFEGGGTITEILVKAGDVVAAGTPLARVDTSDKQIQLDAAKAALDEAKASYQQLLDGATPERRAVAQAVLDKSRAQLTGVAAGVSPADVAAAQQRVTEARARLARIKQGPEQEEVAAAKAGLDAANAELEAGRAQLSAAKTTAEAELLQAANRLRNVQSEYALVMQRIADAGTDKDGNLAPEIAAERDAAQRALENAEQEIKKYQVAFDKTKQLEETGVRAGELRLKAEQLRYQQLTKPTPQDKLAGAQADVANAEAYLARLTGTSHGAAVDAAQQDVTIAQAELKAMTADPTAAELALAQSKLINAEANFKGAQNSIQRATLTAPWAGTVALTPGYTGQSVGNREAVIVLADTSSWLLESETLNELSIIYIKEGAPVTITFAALPDVKITGKVTRVSTVSTGEKGFGTNYGVTITPDTWDPRLRWNMTASVAITIDG